jgi:hypothetical protein
MGTADNSDCDIPIWVCLCGAPPIEGNGNCPSCGAEPPWGSPYDDDDEPDPSYDPLSDVQEE